MNLFLLLIPSLLKSRISGRRIYEFTRFSKNSNILKIRRMFTVYEMMTMDYDALKQLCARTIEDFRSQLKNDSLIASFCRPPPVLGYTFLTLSRTSHE